jgi:hypothetical protein
MLGHFSQPRIMSDSRRKATTALEHQQLEMLALAGTGLRQQRRHAIGVLKAQHGQALVTVVQERRRELALAVGGGAGMIAAGRFTLITSAPWSASSMVPSGPEITEGLSMTRKPCNGAVIVALRVICCPT